METVAGLPEQALSDARFTLVVSEPGSALVRRGDRLLVRVRSETAQELPVFRVEQVVVSTRGASLTSEALRACAEHGVPVSLVDATGTPYAIMSSPHLVGTAATRRAQMRAYDTSAGGALMVAIAAGKLANQATLLKYVAKYRRASAARLHTDLWAAAEAIAALGAEVRAVRPAPPDEIRATVMNLEGRAGAIYWDAVAKALPVEFPGREHRGTADPVNAALNYGYGILQSQVWTAVTMAGLDPFGGFLHVDRPGRPSLVFDLMEEFRPAVVDRAVIALVNLGQGLEMSEGLLDRVTRRLVAERVLERLDARERYGRKHFTLRTIVRLQARAVVTHVRGDRVYRPFASRW